MRLCENVRVPVRSSHLFSVIVAYTVTPDVVLKLTDMDQEIRR